MDYHKELKMILLDCVFIIYIIVLIKNQRLYQIETDKKNQILLNVKKNQEESRKRNQLYYNIMTSKIVSIGDLDRQENLDGIPLACQQKKFNCQAPEMYFQKICNYLRCKVKVGNKSQGK
ncbi:unnamed protein product (macronuclear) [Paramecium tetraurelia]|uniref:Transmembrane protein n=1 Tax=Paramecium tetraurelia TaxID=5888 RepID=A0BDT7_PARTE|nr:uncharacterized protein GSPATT00027734001 [Paramecium tetraurelia]CAK56704.1 unnamed protein product [Paramecium tetraurelia]|eukprot:XP_001424102.1 hypothetical protein (macronuclear) [Paramecium tetraurelia strain d4-2]